MERASHGTVHLVSNQRHHLTAKGIGEVAWVVGSNTLSVPVRAYPLSREWLTLLIPKMVAMGSIYDSPHRCSPASMGSGPGWSSTEGGAATPPSRYTTAAASTLCARASRCGVGHSTAG
ncbi:MAG: hypothetical protein OXG11_12855 [Chloroflexi bacterium]|nr:hypothetical protein [Chloroflexota bacterium]